MKLVFNLYPKKRKLEEPNVNAFGEPVSEKEIRRRIEELNKLLKQRR